MKNRAGIFLDRDGVINKPPPPGQRYILRPEEFQLMPGIAEAIRLFNERNLPVIVVTNQKCVAIGRLGKEGLERIHERMRHLLQEEKAHIDEIRYCPHQDSDGCFCRKPLPGMILDGATALGVDPKASWLVGDQPRDIIAGHAAGCRTVRIGGDAPSHVHGVSDALPDVRLPHTRDLPPWIKEVFPF